MFEDLEDEVLTVFILFVLEDFFDGDFLIGNFVFSCVNNPKGPFAGKSMKLIPTFTNKFTGIITINISIASTFNIVLTTDYISPTPTCIMIDL